MGLAHLCPYVECTNAVAYGADAYPPAANPSTSGQCVCDLHLPLAACPACGILNRAGAAFCRGCRSGLLAGDLALRDTDSARGLADTRPSFTTVPGDFRRGPLFLHASAYALSTDGRLLAVSLRDGAKVRALGAMDPAAAFNQAALVKVAPPASGKSAVQPGWTCLGIGPRKVESISLVTGEPRLLYAPPASSEIAVNPVGSGAGFCAVAASGHLFAFAERPSRQTDSSQISLVVCSFSGQPPASSPGNPLAERPLAIDGAAAIGPVLADDALVLCSARAVGVYDLRSRQPFQVPLPPLFEPLLVRKQGGLNVPVGSIPLTVARGAHGLEAWIGGEESGVPGILAVQLERGSSRFERAPRAATLSSNFDGTLSLAAEDQVRILGSQPWSFPNLGLQEATPAFAAPGCLVSFAGSGRSARHSVTLSHPDRGPLAALAFEDSDCLPESLCGAAVTGTAAAGTDIAVSYLPAGSHKGFTVVHWHLPPAETPRPS